jgi:hypothetical protein
MIKLSDLLLRNSYTPGQTAQEVIHTRVKSILQTSDQNAEKITLFFLEKINIFDLDQILDMCAVFKTKYHIVCKIIRGAEKSPSLVAYPITLFLSSLQER